MSTERRALVLVAIFAAALALRPQLSGVGPLLPEMRRDLGLSHVVGGLLSTLPVLCMGIFAFPASRVTNHLGSRWAIGSFVILIAVAGVLRSLLPGVLVLLGLTALFGVGAGIAGAVLPVVVKQRFPDRPALATGILAFGINIGAAVSAAVAVPLSQAVHGWRSSLAIMACASAVLAIVWLALTRGRLPQRANNEHGPGFALGNRRAWLLALLFGLQGACFYGLNAWLADAYVEHGWSASRAGWLVAILNVATLPATLVVIAAADRVSRRTYLLSSSILLAGAIGGLVTFSPLAWVAAPAAGAACGSLFPVVMTFAIDVATQTDEAAGVVGVMLGGGYIISAIFPLALGVARDASGGFAASLWMLGALAALLVPASLRLTRRTA